MIDFLSKRKQKRASAQPPSTEEKRATEAILKHWRDAAPDDRLAHLVKDAMRGLGRALHMRLAQHKVSYGHWTFLRILWDEEGLTQRELSERAGLQEPTTFSALKAMEKAGFVERRKLPSSRKNVYVYLTPKGRSLKSALVPLAIDVNKTAVQGVSEEDIAVTRRTLLVIIENLARDEAASGGMRRVPSTREQARTLADAENNLQRANRLK